MPDQQRLKRQWRGGFVEQYDTFGVQRLRPTFVGRGSDENAQGTARSDFAQQIQSIAGVELVVGDHGIPLPTRWHVGQRACAGHHPAPPFDQGAHRQQHVGIVIETQHAHPGKVGHCRHGDRHARHRSADRGMECEHAARALA